MPLSFCRDVFTLCATLLFMFITQLTTRAMKELIQVRENDDVKKSHSQNHLKNQDTRLSKPKIKHKPV